MSRRVEVVYDPECPICDYHARNLELAGYADELVLVSARESGELMKQIESTGIDVDEGFVVRENGDLLVGADAMHRLAQINSRRGFSNRVIHSLFRHRRLAKAGYPVLARLRRLLLQILGRKRINTR